MGINDGGPAFPYDREWEAYGTVGMSLRDYFAGQALKGILSRGGDAFVHERAIDSYIYADEMLKARNISDVDSDGKIESGLIRAFKNGRSSRDGLREILKYILDKKKNPSNYVSPMDTDAMIVEQISHALKEDEDHGE
jgi:plasmid stability protein